MTVTASAFPAWGNPMQMPRSLALIVLTARTSVSPLCARGSLSFQRATPPLAPSRFLPPRDLVRKKTAGQMISALTSAQIQRASFSPHGEVSPVLFSQPDQRPSASASDLVSFGEVTKSWPMTACHWQLQMLRSCRAR